MSDTSWPDVEFPSEEVELNRSGSRWAFHGRTEDEWIEADPSAFVELPQ